MKRLPPFFFLALLLLTAAIFLSLRPDDNQGQRAEQAVERPSLPEIQLTNLPEERPPLHRERETLPAHPSATPAPLSTAVDLWPGAEILAEGEGFAADGTFRRVTILAPADLPYRVRIEDRVSEAPDGLPRWIRSEIVADHILVRPADGSAETAQTLAAAIGGNVGERISARGVFRIHLPDPDLDSVFEAIEALNETHAASLAYAEPDPIVRTFASPNDPRYLDGSLWGLHNTGQSGGTSGADINAPEGWAIRTDASAIVVGIVDTGLRLTHEDLAANLWTNPNETANGTDSDGNGFIDDIHGINAITLTGNPNDDQGHGTHVGGTVGAVGNNGIGVTGVAWNVQLMGLKFLSATGGGATSDAIICIDYGVANGAHILNNSWGGSLFSQALMDSIEAARDAGVIFVVAAGNAATDNDIAPIYPASYAVDNIVAVASTTRNDALSAFSCFGQGSVDLGAPGGDILSAGHEFDNEYRTLSGTSMAAPHVAGALALLRAEFPADTWAESINRLYRGGEMIPSLGGGVVATGRRLNLQGALTTTSAQPLNDNFADARELFGDRIVLRTGLHSATAEPGEPAIDGETSPNSIWFRFTPAASGLTSVTALAGESQFNPMTGFTTVINYTTISTVFGIFTGDSVDTLTEVASGNDSVSFTAAAGVTYHIAVAGQAGAEGLVMLEVNAPPRNSTLDNAIALRLNSSISGTNRNALSEPGEPAHAGNPASASVWYKWTANLTARVAFSTRGSGFDTVAAVYSGPASSPAMETLVPVAANDNAPGTSLTFSRVEFQAISGTTYYIAVDGKNGASGALSIGFALPPANDHLDNAFVLTGVDVTRNFTTAFASREEGEPIQWPNAGQGETVWFTWTAPETGRTNLDLSGSFFRGIIAVYTGNSVGNLSLVARDGAGNRFAQVTFDATQGTTYRIAVDAWDFSLTNAPLRLRMVPIPPNDNFASAAELQGLRATATGSNVGSTREPGEPLAHFNGGPSVWYRWTAPATGEYGLYGERLNKPDQWMIVLNVFSGSALNALTHVKADQQNGIGRDAFARFPATAGTTYHIQVTGLTASGILGGTGPFRLDLRPIAEHAPENDHFANAIELDGSPVFNFRTQNYAASAQPGEGQHSGYSASHSLWWKFAVPPGQAGAYAVATSLSEGSTGTTIYRANNPAHPTLGGLTQVASNVEFANQNFPYLTWQAQEGQVYYIVADNYGNGLGRLIFNFQKVPANITFANATVIPAEGLNEITYNWGAVRESGEPTSGFTPATAGHRSLWWRWTAPASGRYQVDTIGSRLAVAEDRPISVQFGSPTILGLDTVLGVYTGSSVSALTAVATNSRIATYSGSNWSFQRNSRLEFNAVAGTTYHIMVNGHAPGSTDEQRAQNTHQGEIHFNFTRLIPPANDAFADATEITGTDYQTIVSNLGATKQSGEPNHGGITTGRTLWWKWTAPESGPFIVSTAGNLYDDYNARRTGLGVYTGTAVNALTTVASNQNGAGINTGEFTWSAASFNAVAGTTYHFGVDSVHAGNLSFLLTRPAPNDHFANATVMAGSRWIARGHNLLTTVEPGETKIEAFFNPPPVTNTTVRSVWWRWTAPVSGTITLDSLGSQMYNVIGVYSGPSLSALTPMVVTNDSGDFINGEGPNRARSGNKRVIFEAVAGTTYQITVQGAGFNAASSGPILLSLSGPPAVPFAPENFTAVRVGSTQIELDWDDVAVDEELYELQRSSDGAAWTDLVQLNPDTESFTDFEAPGVGDFFYRIRAVNSVGQSAWVTAAVSTPQPPPAPANLQIIALSSSDLRITWNAPATAQNQRLERSTDPDGPWMLLSALLPADASAFTDTGLEASTTYYYRIRASNSLGHSDWTIASGMTESPEAFTLDMPASVRETVGSFTATVSRTGASGDQTLMLTSNDARLSVPSTIIIPDGQNSVDFTITVNDDAIINPDGIGTITAFVPAALAGETFTGPVNSSVDAQNTGWGWSGPWYHGGSVHATLVEPALSYTKNGTIGTPGTQAARLVQNANGGSEARRNFASKISEGDVWVSTLLFRNSNNWTTQLTVRENTGGGNWARVRYHDNSQHWVLDAGSAIRAPLHNANPFPTTLYVVMHFDFTARKIHAYLNPEVAGEVPTNWLATATVDMQAALTGVSRVDFGGWSNLDQFDELRVATSFAHLHGGVTITRAIRILDDEAATPLQLWQLTHFTTEELADSNLEASLWGSLADPDGDGIPNLMEFALGGDPWTARSAQLPDTEIIAVNGEQYLALRITKNPEAVDIDYQVVVSGDLDGWQSGVGHTVILSETSEELIVRDATPLTDHQRRFIRLRVSQ